MWTKPWSSELMRLPMERIWRVGGSRMAQGVVLSSEWKDGVALGGKYGSCGCCRLGVKISVQFGYIKLDVPIRLPGGDSEQILVYSLPILAVMNYHKFSGLKQHVCGFPDGSVGRESACNAGDTGDVGSIPGSGRFPGGGTGNPLQYSCLKNPTDRGA